MRLRPLAILLTIPLWACASKPESSAGSSSAPAGSSAQTTPSTPTALDIIATPLYVVFKIPVCVGAAPLLGPGVIASAIVPFKDNSKGSGNQLLANEVREACGPPWLANAH